MNQASANTPGNHFRWLLLILLLSVALRLGLAFYLGDNTNNWLGGTADQVSYDNLALRLLAGHGFSFGEAWWPATAVATVNGKRKTTGVENCRKLGRVSRVKICVICLYTELHGEVTEIRREAV